jgi:hypothetical protein
VLRFLLHAFAVFCLIVAAFGWLKNDTVNWFYLGIAFWCAAYLPFDDVSVPRARRADR